MTDKPDEKPLPITDPHKVPAVFVNSVCNSGHLNHVVNITFATALFTPSDNNKVDPDMIVTARLRMDLVCAQQLHECLDRIMKQVSVKPDGESAH